MATPQRNYKNEIVDLKFPFDIVNLKARTLLVKDIGSSLLTKTWDVTCFSTVKFQLSQIDRAIAKDYPEYQHKVYAYRATKKGNGTIIDKMKFFYKIDHNTKFVHVNVELIPKVEETPEDEPEHEPDLIIPSLDSSP